VEVAATPKQVVEQCDVTYAILSTPEANSAVFYGMEGGHFHHI
jgi:3-hydroxyisobutyrate dehydrogenase-like beta-hydroxyacid dehydrogenase